MKRSQTVVLIGIGLTIAAAWRFASEPSRLSLGALVLVALATLGAAIGVLLMHRRGLEGSGARRRAMIAADVGWFADVHFDDESLESLVGAEKASGAPATAALGLSEDGIDVWLDEFGRAAVLPAGRARVLSGKGTTQSVFIDSEAGGALAFEIVGPLWGAVPAGHSAAVESVMFINGPYAPGADPGILPRR